MSFHKGPSINYVGSLGGEGVGQKPIFAYEGEEGGSEKTYVGKFLCVERNRENFNANFSFQN